MRLSDADLKLILSALYDSHMEELSNHETEESEKEIIDCQKLCFKLSTELRKRESKKSSSPQPSKHQRT